jgi:PTH1 family peptidyl-tRNA hydrolase
MLGRLRGLFARRARQPARQPIEKMICGLGNPGPSYAHTRHNIGYQVVERLAAAADRSAWAVRSGQARLCEVSIGGTGVLLVQPLTFMNRSGEAVRPLLRRLRLAPADLLVVCDDLDLPFGAIRLRAAGSAGGHRGVQSIIDQLGTQEFPRLRVGIGRPPEGEDPVSYVLGLIPRNDRQQLDQALDQAAAAARTWVTAGLEATMNSFNTASPPPPPGQARRSGHPVPPPPGQARRSGHPVPPAGGDKLR